MLSELLSADIAHQGYRAWPSVFLKTFLTVCRVRWHTVGGDTGPFDWECPVLIEHGSPFFIDKGWGWVKYYGNTSTRILSRWAKCFGVLFYKSSHWRRTQGIRFNSSHPTKWLAPLRHQVWSVCYNATSSENNFTMYLETLHRTAARSESDVLEWDLSRRHWRGFYC